jgi:hypothetical protein
LSKWLPISVASMSIVMRSGAPNLRPDMLASSGVRVAQRVQQPGRPRVLVDDPEPAGVRRDRPEQRVLITHRTQVGEAVSAVGEHHRHAARVVPGVALVQARQAHRQRPRQSALVGNLRQQRAAACDTSPSPSDVTSTVTLRPSRCTFKVILPSRGFRASQTQTIPA